MRKVSKQDEEILLKIRANIAGFMRTASEKYDEKNIKILDIAPQDHKGAAGYFKRAQIDTLDINPSSKATYIADLTKNNSSIIKDSSFDIIVCTEVLEHTLNPFSAVDEIYRMLKPKGIALISTPFMFRIHGPLPDCWRFSTHGLAELFKKFSSIKINELEDKQRFLAPLQYTVIAQK